MLKNTFIITPRQREITHPPSSIFWKMYFPPAERGSDDALIKDFIKPSLANVRILYSFKSPDNRRISGVFRGFEMGTLAGDGLTDFIENDFVRRKSQRINFKGKVLNSSKIKLLRFWSHIKKRRTELLS